jgi:hypothetical protein
MLKKEIKSDLFDLEATKVVDLGEEWAWEPVAMKVEG